MTAQVLFFAGKPWIVTDDGQRQPVPDEIVAQVDEELPLFTALKRYASKVGLGELIPRQTILNIPHAA